MITSEGQADTTNSIPSNSEDHRGTPEKPGRVVTLISREYWGQLTDHHDSAPEKVWGVAYRIEADRVAEVKEYLDIREINGYTIHYTPFHPAPGTDPSLLPRHGPIKALVYIGTPDNEQFVGPQDPQQLAEHIYRSEGPSGLNRDYLFGLERALDELSPESGDEHVTDLSNRVRAVAAVVVSTAAAARELGDIGTDKQILSAQSPVNVSSGLDPEEDHHHHHHHDFRKVSSVDEQEETEKTL
ncbi:hypothetical protein QBC35DRAFT_447037 [Podospora australis]|uniref:glutathione-specific gamma-glutamylcyclotransferase n=1 Tax=Podospora australis TaxID=1536484 RepID=A0AAN7AMZ2_9PEZI|nr:hypothetical protein QBC35DRAFT_447037 [Podospora australis]